MKNCIALNVFLLLFMAQLNANTNPVLDNNGVPLAPGEAVTSKELFLDFSIPTVKEESLPVAGKESAIGQRFQFPDLDKQLTAAIEDMVSEIEQDDMADVTNIPENAEEKKGKKAIEEAKTGGTKIESLADLTDLQLPAYYVQPIGNLEAIVVINSLKMIADPTDGLDPGGRIGLYVGIKIPQKTRDQNGNLRTVTLIFGSEEIAFTSSGGISAGNIQLVNDAWFETSGSKKKAIVRLDKGNIQNHEQHSPQNTGTYIRFGCNGVEEFSIEGAVHFSREWILPANEDGEAITDGTGRVSVEIGVKVQDWNNMLITVNTNKRFVLTKFKNVSFFLTNCTVDLSDYENPAGMTFPKEFVFSTDDFPQDDFPDINATQFADDVPADLKNLWRGVHIEYFEVTFPKPFKKKCDGNLGNSSNTNAEGCRLKVAAQNLIIDRTGVSGKFLISGQAPLTGGTMMDNKWSWSLDEIGVAIVQNRFDQLQIKGGLVVPITKRDTPFELIGRIDFSNPNPLPPSGPGEEEQEQTQGHEYFFSVKAEGKVEFPVFKAFNVTLTSAEIQVTVQNDQFKPKAILSGMMSLGKGGGAANKEDVKIPKLEFKDLTLITEENYIVEGSVFLKGGGNKLNNFPIQISGIGLGLSNTNKVHLAFNLGLHLMKQEDGGLSATGLVKVHGEIITNVLGAQEWRFKEVTMDGFAVEIDLPAIKGEGSLHLFDGNDDYGKGFSAALEATVLPKEADSSGQGGHEGFELKMAAIFGNKDGMRYFMLDGFASGPALTVPLPPTPLSLTGFGGGVQYRMKVDGYVDPGSIPEGSVLPIGADVSGLIYKPDPSTLFGIKFSTSITTTGVDAAGGSPITGLLSCIIRFGPGLSLQNIMFWGTAELINPVANGGIGLTSGMDQRVEGLTKSQETMHKEDKKEVDEAVDKIAAKVGLSLDFYDGFSLHGFAEVNMKASQGKLTGKGQLDLWIDPNGSSLFPDGRWHYYIGGYENEAVTVPDFFHPENEIVLYPVNAQLTYDELAVTASAYMLMGNDLPGPPPLNAAAANFFGVSQNSNAENRATLEECSDPAMGTGLAFGANMTIKYEKKITEKILFVPITILDIKAIGGAGFDIALIQYDQNTTFCAGGASGDEHGVNGFRATGNIWALISVTGEVLGMGLPGIGLGVLLQADIPNPSFFRAVAVLRAFGNSWDFDFDIGTECGPPCSIVE